MHDSSLRDDLLAIPGVEGAEVEGTDDRPAGLRIRIAEGADQGAVGTAIRRVLTSHGLGTDTRLPGEPDPGTERGDAPETDPGPSVAAAPPRGSTVGEPAPAPEVTTEPDEDPGGSTIVAVAEEPPEAELPAADAPVIDLTDRSDGGVADAVPPPAAPLGADQETTDSEQPVDAAVTDEAPTAAPPRLEPVAERRLASVAVEEGRDGVLVRVSTTTGAVVEQHAASSEGGVESAVVRATAHLASPGAPEARVVEIDDRRVEGADIVTIVLDVDGKLRAGSAVVVAGRSFALGRATWAALSL